MAEKFEETAIIIRQEEIADDIYSMWLHTDRIAAHAKAGQFVSVYCNDGSRLLPRPISICEIDKKDGAPGSAVKSAKVQRKKPSTT